jgi:hypothetical protein
VHPRTRGNLAKFGVDLGPNIALVGPQAYMAFLNLWKDAAVVLTDSGGMQEETTALGVPCITIRENTERPVTVEEGSNVLAGTDPAVIVAEARKVLRMLLAHPELAHELDDDALHVLAASAPDHGEMLRRVVQAAKQVSGEAGFAVLAEQLRGGGDELDVLITEVLAEPLPDLAPARLELAGAVRQAAMRALRAEQDRLVAEGLADDHARARYREIGATLEQLRLAGESDLADGPPD